MEAYNLKSKPGEEVRKTLLAFPDTDAGNAEAFELLFGSEFRFDHTRGLWLVWNGQYWATDRTNAADRAALETARARRYVAAIKIGDSKEGRTRVDWALNSESVSRRRALLESAQSVESLATTAADYDSDQFLLNVANGTVELKIGAFRNADPNDLITRTTDICFTSRAQCELWPKFLHDIFREESELIRFVQKAVGYSLTGDTREQCLFLLYGSGANGKTTFLEILLKLLGTYATLTPFTSLLVQRNQASPRNDIARLQGARLVKASESPENCALDEAVVKEITGGDKIAARFLFHEFFDYVPQFKIWVATNHKPVIHGTDDAIWRRIRLIPFTRQFVGEERDAQMLQKLASELPGILNWAIEGCLAWQAEGLGTVRIVETATREYRHESDHVGRFLLARCSQGDRLSCGSDALFQAYKAWCAEHRVSAETQQRFNSALAERGINKKRRRSGIVYLGVALNDPP